MSHKTLDGAGTEARCPDCGASWMDGITCQDHFHQMSAWELEDPKRLGRVHHLMVLCFHMQHPVLYSPDGLEMAKRLLIDFLVNSISPQEARRRGQAALDSGRRKFKIKGTPVSHGAYLHPVQWTMTAADVTAGGMDRYCENVEAWAQSVLEALGSAGELTQ